MSTTPAVGREPETRAGINSAATGGVSRSRYIILLVVMAIALGFSACASCGKNGAEEAAEAAPPPDPIADCRDLAAEDPYDEDAEASAEIAYAACSEAAELAPNDAEIIYRLGLAAFQSGRMDVAAENFRKAEQMGYCKAIYFLGEDAWYGQQNAASAEELYKRGAACGDERAATELFSPETFSQSARPELIAALYNSDMQQLNKVRFVAASYVAGFYEALCEQYQGEGMETCWKADYCRGARSRRSYRPRRWATPQTSLRAQPTSGSCRERIRSLSPASALEAWKSSGRRSGPPGRATNSEWSRVQSVKPCCPIRS